MTSALTPETRAALALRAEITAAQGTTGPPQPRCRYLFNGGDVWFVWGGRHKARISLDRAVRRVDTLEAQRAAQLAGRDWPGRAELVQFYDDVVADLIGAIAKAEAFAARLARAA